MPLFTIDSGDDSTVEEQLKSVEQIFNHHNFRVVFWPYRSKNSGNTISFKGLNGASSGDAMTLWGKAAQLFGGQMGYILPIVFAEYRGDVGMAGATWKMPLRGLIGSMIRESRGGTPKHICTVNTKVCVRGTTAHEIGHAADLEHHDDPNNLMFSNGTKRKLFDLESDQLDKIKTARFAA